MIPPEHVPMRIRRFKVDDLTGPAVHIGGQEATHALRVLRLKTGAEVVLFDGRGGEARGRVRSISRRTLEVEITRPSTGDAIVDAGLTIATAVPKGNRGDWLVEKCAELGVGSLCLLSCERSQVIPGDGKLARWQRKGVEAAKQTGHAVTMTIEPPRSIQDIGSESRELAIFYGDPARSRVTFGEALAGLADRQGVLVFVGPEGGFTDEECAEIEQAGGRPVRLSEGILRVETAAVATAAIWGCWGAGGHIAE